MKHKAVESMIRKQLNLQDNVKIDVEIVSIETNETNQTLTYEFNITFVDNDGSYNKLVYKITQVKHIKIR